MRARQVEGSIERSLVDNAVLWCSEEKAHHRHRRLVAEYLRDHWGDISIDHLG
jgi:hypothetical protein